MELISKADEEMILSKCKTETDQNYLRCFIQQQNLIDHQLNDIREGRASISKISVQQHAFVLELDYNKDVG